MKITFYGHFGSLNTGNESTLRAIHSCLRALAPDSEFSCVCSYPEMVSAREGIEALPINARVVKLWKHDEGMRWDRRLTGAFVGLKEELREYVRAFRSLKGTDVLIVPGTGLVTDAYGIAGWGPYNQFKWALMAKLRGCKVVFLSVGVGPVHRLSGRTARASVSSPRRLPLVSGRRKPRVPEARCTSAPSATASTPTWRSGCRRPCCHPGGTATGREDGSSAWA